MEGLLDLLIDLDDAGVCALSRAGLAIVLHFDPCRTLRPLPARLRLGLEARRLALLPLLRKLYVPAGVTLFVDYI